MTTYRLTRRGFLAQTAAVGAGVTLASAASVGANERINVGVIGLGSQGNGNLDRFATLPGVRIAAICDVDRDRLDATRRRVSEKNNGNKLKTATDLSEMLDNPDIDAVVISTCNHWHCLAAIWACAAGKDVYVEKPLGHNVWEERQTVSAAREHGRIVQVGTQQRSDPMQAELKEFLHTERALGAPKHVIAARIGARASVGKRDTALAPPKSVDYNLWLGPAQDQPIFRDKLHYDWHWDWNTGGGEMGNWGVHVLDDVRNVALLDKPLLPRSVTSGGGRVAWDDAGQTPNVHFTLFETSDVPVLFALSNLKPGPDTKAKLGYTGPGSGYVVYCEGGTLAGQRGAAKAFDNDGKQIKSFRGNAGTGHAANFIDAVRSRNHQQLTADVETGHYSSSWCHLANIACTTADATQFDSPATKQTADAPWSELVETMKMHLDDHDINLAAGQVTLSQPLEVDEQAERFSGEGSDQANEWIRRECRNGFEVK